MIKLYVASDHAGINLKSKILLELAKSPYVAKYEVHDLGPHSTDSVDYPDYADLVCRKIRNISMISAASSEVKPSVHHELGILICGSGQGMAMRANKFSHIRAALCWSTETARLSREHNDANILCMGERVIEHDLAIEILRTFLVTDFAGGRHQGRVVKVCSPV